MDMKLEVSVVPVATSTEQAHEQLGWQLDADFVTSPDSRVVQFTHLQVRRRRYNSARA